MFPMNKDDQIYQYVFEASQCSFQNSNCTE